MPLVPPGSVPLVPNASELAPHVLFREVVNAHGEQSVRASDHMAAVDEWALQVARRDTPPDCDNSQVVSDLASLYDTPADAQLLGTTRRRPFAYPGAPESRDLLVGHIRAVALGAALPIDVKVDLLDITADALNRGLPTQNGRHIVLSSLGRLSSEAFSEHVFSGAPSRTYDHLHRLSLISRQHIARRPFVIRKVLELHETVPQYMRMLAETEELSERAKTLYNQSIIR